ncbi:hypothetical protein EDD70_0909 [Hydrogenoanaerobacterium saccharovorans]|uniref:Uncharacterized protein n=1 Tax=Hydrogenoanaerobacterium saccharovorans TaxID=474960 RepID=A0A1H8AAP5_9FIRM|nr:hypothetical protein EDD70_0909 [Hydrogenoanaerobacterium saccharovorans]SEM66859.1 hypothetical protein SAMN05216180_1182 [Hydrogenoanaerobacterium saccharovorans]
MVAEYAKEADIDSWMNLLDCVKESFPGLNITEYKKVI